MKAIIYLVLALCLVGSSLADIPSCLTAYHPNWFDSYWPFTEPQDANRYYPDYLCQHYNGVVQSCDEFVRQWEWYNFPLLFVAPTCPNIPPITDGLFEETDETILFNDQYYDRVIRLTSNTKTMADVINGTHPDLLQYRYGAWYAHDSYFDLFNGTYDPEWGEHFRLDFLFKGLINPPGPTNTSFNPTAYGPNPLYGFVEFDIDHNVNTGGALGNEINPPGRPQDAWLANVGRFGYRPWGDPYFSQRTAESYNDGVQNFFLLPYTKRSGTDFVLHFTGYGVVSVEKRVYVVFNESMPDCSSYGLDFPEWGGNYCLNNSDVEFTAGDVWVLHGAFLCRATGYNVLAFWQSLQGSPDGIYCPGSDVYNMYPQLLMFNNSVETGKTTVSFIWSLTQPPESMNYLESDYSSMIEALQGLNVAAYNYDMSALGDIIKDWRQENAYAMLNPWSWNLHMMFGTTYRSKADDGMYYVWTDIAPEQIPGDMSADFDATMTDTQMIYDYIINKSCNVNYDTDGNCTNLVLQLPNVPKNFDIHDINYDGKVDVYDIPVIPTPIPPQPPS